MGNPWIFSQINSYMINPENPMYYPSLEEKLDVMVKHIEAMVSYKGEHTALLQARKLVTGYLRESERRRTERRSGQNFYT